MTKIKNLIKKHYILTLLCFICLIWSFFVGFWSTQTNALNNAEVITFKSGKTKHVNNGILLNNQYAVKYIGFDEETAKEKHNLPDKVAMYKTSAIFGTDLNSKTIKLDPKPISIQNNYVVQINDNKQVLINKDVLK